MHLRVARSGINQLGQRRIALPGRHQLTHPRAAAVEVAGQALALGVIEHREQHRRITLNDAGQRRQRRGIVVPDGLGRHTGQQLGHGVAGLLEILLEHLAQLRLLVLELAGKTAGEALTGIAGECGEAGAHFLFGAAQLGGQALALATEALRQVVDQTVDGSARQPDGKPDLDQHGQAESDEDGAQQAAAQQ